MMKPLDFLILRTPLQSLRLASQEADPEVHKDFFSGLQLAAPDLYNEFNKKSGQTDKEKNKIRESIFKYWLRSCSRCTPYGVFAGYQIVNLCDTKTSLVISESKKHKLSNRVDMSYLFLLKTKIENDPNILSQIHFSVNNSLYETPSGFRFTEYVLKGDFRTYKLSSIEKSEYLSFIFEILITPQKLSNLAYQLIENFPQLDEEEAYSFIDELRTNQILISELELNLTGSDPLETLIQKISILQGAEEILQKLQSLHSLILENNKILDYPKIRAVISSIFDTVNAPRDTIQVDLQLSTESNTIEKDLVNKITEQISSLSVMSRLHQNNNLEDFKSRFQTRFEEEEIPLNIALDNDLGIGYGSGHKGVGNIFVDNLPTPANTSPQSNPQDYITEFTFNKYLTHRTNGEDYIEITENELQGMRQMTKEKKFATSQFIFGSLLKTDEQGVNSFLFDLKTVGGPSAANVLGRFSLGNDELTKLIRSALEYEESEFPDVIFAEIVHNPQTRLGNILLRSHLRTYEIPYLGHSGVSLENQIPLSDIMVSVKNGEIILRSVKYNRRVIPRLSTAHNYVANTNLPIYRFLCELQNQTLHYPHIWDWGTLSKLKYLPRVCYKNIIIKKARWIIEMNDVKSSELGELTKLEQLVVTNEIPRFVVIVEGDNRLLIDLQHQKALSVLLLNLKKSQKIFLEEFLFNENNCIVTDINGLPFTNEMIIPVQRAFEKVDTNKINTFLLPKSKRRFPPSSEWLYLKLYAGESTLDKIVTDVLFPFVKTGIEKKSFEKFFFIRYYDEAGTHLRIRFLNQVLSKQENLQTELMFILTPFLDTKFVHNIIIDTYVREIERYSDELIGEAETLFYHDSIAVMEINDILNQVENPDHYRVIFALRGIDIFLTQFGYNLDQKIELSKALAQSFFIEFGRSIDLKKSLNDRYRKIQKEIFLHMTESKDVENGIKEVIDVFGARSKLDRPIIANLKTKLTNANNEVFLNKVLKDFVHMFNNRLFKSSQRKHELIVYTFLEKYYSSQKAIILKADLTMNTSSKI